MNDLVVPRMDESNGQRLGLVINCKWRPVRIQALAVAVGAATVPGLGHVPVLVAVRSITLLAESRIVVEPGRMDLGESREGRKAWLIRPARLASIGLP